jgi:phosphatidate phosphatase APP1
MLVIALSHTAWARFQLITDFDDTIKITNTLNNSAAGWNTAFSRAVFTGTTELYKGWAHAGAQINVVSGGLSAFSTFTLRDLNYNSIPFLALYERPSLADTIYNFKYKTISGLASRNGDKYVLIGDDTQSDFDVYSILQKTNPNKFIAAYIHRVTGRSLPSNVQPYYTDFEVAVFENAAGRFSDADLASSAQAILKMTSVKYLFPKFVVCPKTIDDFSPAYFDAISRLSSPLRSQATRVTSIIVNACLKHFSDED